MYSVEVNKVINCYCLKTKNIIQVELYNFVIYQKKLKIYF